MPSTVVNRPPSVPGSTLRLSSGHDMAHDSDLSISLERSSLVSTDRVIRRPFSGISPPVLTSLLRSDYLSKHHLLSISLLTATMIAYCTHKDDLRKVRYVDHLHVGSTWLSASCATCRERVDLVLYNFLVHVVHRRLRRHLRIHL